VVTASLLSPIIHILVEVLGAMAKFFTVHFTKTMTVSGLVIAVVCALVFFGTKK
jgi:hypothetical protein